MESDDRQINSDDDDYPCCINLLQIDQFVKYWDFDPETNVIDHLIYQ